MSLKRFPWVLTFTVAVALAILVTLGVWQLRRMVWKQGILAQREAALKAEPQWLPNVMASGKAPVDLHQTRVVFDCPGLDQAPFVELYGLKDGRTIRRLISACALGEGPYDAILVDRGYILDDERARPKVIVDTFPVRVIGALHSPQAERTNAIAQALVAAPQRPVGAAPFWMERDLEGMAKDLGVQRPAPWFLMAETSSNPDWPALVATAPQADVAVTPQRHFSYAMTWFGLAISLIGIYAAMLFRRFKTQ